MKIIEKIKNWWQQDNEAILRKLLFNQMIEYKKLSVEPLFFIDEDSETTDGDILDKRLHK